MYVDNYEFKDWMQKLLDKLEGVGKDVIYPGCGIGTGTQCGE